MSEVKKIISAYMSLLILCISALMIIAMITTSCGGTIPAHENITSEYSNPVKTTYRCFSFAAVNLDIPTVMIQSETDVDHVEIQMPTGDVYDARCIAIP